MFFGIISFIFQESLSESKRDDDVLASFWQKLFGGHIKKEKKLFTAPLRGSCSELLNFCADDFPKGTKFLWVLLKVFFYWV